MGKKNRLWDRQQDTNDNDGCDDAGRGVDESRQWEPLPLHGAYDLLGDTEYIDHNARSLYACAA